MPKRGAPEIYAVRHLMFSMLVNVSLMEIRDRVGEFARYGPNIA